MAYDRKDFGARREGMPYHGNHSGKRVEGRKSAEWTGTAQRNYGKNEESAPFEADPKKRAFRPGRFEREDTELPENLLVGRNPIREAIKAGRPMEKLLVMKGDLSGAAKDIVQMARKMGVVVQEVEKARLDQVYPNHQGLLAYVSMASYSTMEEIYSAAEEKGEDAFIVVLDGVTDPHNLGAIIRSAECAGAHGVVVSERRSAGLNPACVKAAAGALEYMKVARVTNITRTLEDMKERGVWVYAADMDGADLYEADLKGPIAIVIGAEGEGVSQLVRKTCDGAITIPMSGHINSLNASVAAGIILFETARARKK